MSEYTHISGNTKVVELQGEEAEAMRRGCGIGALTEKRNEILEKYKDYPHKVDRNKPFGEDPTEEMYDNLRKYILEKYPIISQYRLYAMKYGELSKVAEYMDYWTHTPKKHFKHSGELHPAYKAKLEEMKKEGWSFDEEGIGTPPKEEEH